MSVTMLLPNIHSLLATFRLSVMMMLPHKIWGVKVKYAFDNPVFLTKNGYAKYAIVDIKEYDLFVNGMELLKEL